ncbi:alpha/beta hydrolase [Enterococcus canis]|uniref:Alpha/beta hydrolase n=1 Tax=Enterococcus canis TaxID=214095 RepID=A0A1L8RHB2_9ENTE|nr:alpha/beta hydrolase [Enterococcus canis]OJG19146.1 alpha/beta hydrolase [Enterococcus canis]
MKVRNKYATMTDGTRIHYQTLGHGEPLILLHGNGGSLNYFKYQFVPLAKHFRVIALDSRGHGKSNNLASSLSFQLMASDLATVMALENIQQADILGFSDGANYALVFTKMYPEKVRKLVLNAGNTTFFGLRFTARIVSYLEYAAVKMASIFSKKAQQFLPVAGLLLHDIGVSTQDLKKIQQPALVIVGKHDLIKLSHSLYLTDTLPHSSLVLVPKQGHTVARKDADNFNQLVLQFLMEKQVTQ